MLVGVAAGGLLLWLTARPLLDPVLHPGGRPVTLAELVAAGCATGALATWAGLGAGTLACAVAGVRGWSVRTRWLPRAIPVLVAAALGVAAPAIADDVARPALEKLDGLRVPDRPVGALGAPRAPASAADRSWTVHAGDCLWSLAEAHLGGRPTAAEVDRAWRTVYRANRAAIGADPDLLRPGTRLTVPAPAFPTRRPTGGTP